MSGWKDEQIIKQLNSITKLNDSFINLLNYLKNKMNEEWLTKLMDESVNQWMSEWINEWMNKSLFTWLFIHQSIYWINWLIKTQKTYMRIIIIIKLP